jgi:hypothetical protein
MAWTYRQTNGALLRPDGTTLTHGYSGAGQWKNDPASESLHNRGPIPKGLYHIGSAVNTVTHGPFVLPLTPSPANTMHGRDGFLIHGDSVTDPGTASEGCIILPRAIREAIGVSGDTDLAVVE